MSFAQNFDISLASSSPVESVPNDISDSTGVESPSSTTDFGLDVIEQETVLGNEDIRVIAARLIDTALGFLGVIFFLIVLYSGFLWLLSGGDEEKTGKAKKTLGNAIVGLILIMMAYTIVRFVFGALSPATGTGTVTPM